jgi:hypothetical protein
LPPGTYRIFEQGQAGWVNTTPESVEVTTRRGDAVAVDFGNFRTVRLSGQKFNDANGNGVKDAGELHLTGWQIQLDLGSNGTIDRTAVTDAQGNYLFGDVGPGTHRLGEQSMDGFIQTLPGSGSYTITASSGTNRTGLDFGNDGTAPTVAAFRLIYADSRMKNYSGIRMDFSEPMHATAAQALSNYALQSGKKLKVVDLLRADLSADGLSVTLALASPAKVGYHRLTVQDALTDRPGIPLDGDKNGVPGGDYTVDFGRDLTILEPDGDAGSLAISAGIMTLHDNTLQLLDTGPGDTLSGKVKAPSTGSDRIVRLNAINGLNGAVNKLPHCSADKPDLCFEVAQPIAAAAVDTLLESESNVVDFILRSSRRKKRK